MIHKNEVTTWCMSETLSLERPWFWSTAVFSTLVNGSFGQALNPVLGYGLKPYWEWRLAGPSRREVHPATVRSVGPETDILRDVKQDHVTKLMDIEWGITGLLKANIEAVSFVSCKMLLFGLLRLSNHSLFEPFDRKAYDNFCIVDSLTGVS